MRCTCNWLFFFLHKLVTPEERAGILKVLGQVHIADDSSEEDLKIKEQVIMCKCNTDCFTMSHRAIAISISIHIHHDLRKMFILILKSS